MNVVQNEFILLINAFYQADALTKNIAAPGLFGNIQIQPELSQFREMFVEDSEIHSDIIRCGDANAETGKFEKVVLGLELKSVYKVTDHFLQEIESSISEYKHDNRDMTSYRISFQMASDYIYNFVGETIKSSGKHIPLKDAIFNIIESILNENYWEGEILKEQISLIRYLKTDLNFSENWIKEYAYKMFAAKKTL